MEGHKTRVEDDPCLHFFGAYGQKETIDALKEPLPQATFLSLKEF